ncbi:MAG: NAD(P)-dependent oxidoreductase [Leptospiraceae bacterium]|nr:NAD(P)-dependent oxidoreductase [Leptospiraceae bacterium]
MSKKILVTGATGALGYLMCNTLVKNKHQVVGYLLALLQAIEKI